MTSRASRTLLLTLLRAAKPLDIDRFIPVIYILDKYENVEIFRLPAARSDIDLVIDYKGTDLEKLGQLEALMPVDGNRYVDSNHAAQ